MSKNTEFKIPRRVTDAIAAYQEHIAERESRAEKVRTRNAELTQELAAAKAELQTAMDKVIEDPTAVNEKAETEARRKLAELTMQVAGGEERGQRAFQTGSSKGRELHVAAAKVGKEEAFRYYEENFDKVMKEIAAAKKAYLQALVGFYDLKSNAEDIWRQGSMNADRFGPIVEAVGGEPHFRGVEFTNHLSAPNHGIFDGEIRQAAKYGKIN